MAEKREIQFTYTNDPSTSVLDTVRFLAQDTNPAEPILDDREIEYLIDTYTSPQRAAIHAARQIAMHFAGLPDIKTGVVRITNAERAKRYSDLADELERKVNILAIPYAGGISVSDKAAREVNTDRVEPAFTRTTLEPA